MGVRVQMGVQVTVGVVQDPTGVGLEVGVGPQFGSKTTILPSNPSKLKW